MQSTTPSLNRSPLAGSFLLGLHCHRVIWMLRWEIFFGLYGNSQASLERTSQQPSITILPYTQRAINSVLNELPLLFPLSSLHSDIMQLRDTILGICDQESSTEAISSFYHDIINAKHYPEDFAHAIYSINNHFDEAFVCAHKIHNSIITYLINNINTSFNDILNAKSAFEFGELLNELAFPYLADTQFYTLISHHAGSLTKKADPPADWAHFLDYLQHNHTTDDALINCNEMDATTNMQPDNPSFQWQLNNICSRDYVRTHIQSIKLRIKTFTTSIDMKNYLLYEIINSDSNECSSGSIIDNVAVSVSSEMTRLESARKQGKSSLKVSSTDERNEWMLEQRKKGMQYNEINYMLNQIAQEKNWTCFNDHRSISTTLKRYQEKKSKMKTDEAS